MAAAVALLTLTAAGCSGADSPAAAPSPRTATVATDLTALVVPRAPFCDSVPDVLLRSVVPSTPDPTVWGNGDPVGGVEGADVAHEYGCTWAGGTTTLSAWVQAPPVTAEQAAALAAGAVSRTCAVGTGAEAFGLSPVAVTCTGDDPAVGTVRWSGLFQDAWLTCEVTAPTAQDPAALAAAACPALVTAAAS